MLERLCILTSHFPTPENPTRYPFVDQLACSFADAGRAVSVVVPGKPNARYRPHWRRETPGGRFLEVYEPAAPSFSCKNLGPIHTGRWTYRAFLRAARAQIKRLPQRPDAIYAHFLAPSGCAAAQLGAAMGLPSFCAYGESSLWTVNMLGLDCARAQFAPITGVISVSSENKRILVENRLCPAERIGVFPNGVQHGLFYPRDRAAMRAKLGLPQGEVIGIFTGSFDERKGALRAQAAAAAAGLKMLFLGGGPLLPAGDNVLFAGKVAHASIAEYLSAADFFVLPTRSEGCCNAIIEAMACGLPIVSSVGAFNDDILAATYALRVDPDDAPALQRALCLFMADRDLRARMGAAARQASLRFDVDARAADILQFMEERAQNGK